MERRLAAILAADMVGYSRLMAADETGTIARQKQHPQGLMAMVFVSLRQCLAPFTRNYPAERICGAG